MTDLTEVYLVFCHTMSCAESLREVFASREDAEEYIKENEGLDLYIVEKELY